MRSRPWRSRGPWFDNRAGARRRGRRADELVTATLDDPPMEDVVAAGITVAEMEDVILPIAPVWPLSSRTPATWVAHDRGNALTPHGSGPDRSPSAPDPMAEAIFAGQMLSAGNDDSANSTSRQSA